MTTATREILYDTMRRDWVQSWAGLPGMRTGDYNFSGSASEAVADFRRRFPTIAVDSGRLVMDDGDWTIRVRFADGSIATLFASAE